MLHEGQVLALDQPGRLRTSLTGTLFEVVVPQPRDAQDVLAGRSEVAGVQVFGDRLHVWMQDADAGAAAATLAKVADSAAINATTIRPIVPSLEDVFISKVLDRNPS